MEERSLQDFGFVFPYPFMCFNRKGELQSINPAGSYVFDIWPTQAGQVLEGFWSVLINDVVKNETSKETEYKVAEKVFNLLFVLSDDGKFVYVVGFDITDFRKDQEEKNQMEKELKQLQKSESLGRLAGGIAHDFNNILTPILGYAELAKMGSKGNELLEDCINNILTAAHRAKDLVQKILTFSRQTKTERKILDINEIIKEVLSLLRSTLPKNIELKTSLSQCGNIFADSTQIHQIIMNLCTNAWHAIQPDSGEIEISVEEIKVDINLALEHPALKQDKKYIKLSVRDTGKGMDKETIKHIFDPFFTTKSVGEGTGLGLSMVDGIVKSHEGDISVESTPGKGTVFNIFLPVVEYNEQFSKHVNTKLPVGNEKILLIDDEEIIVSLITKALSMLGYKIERFTDPEKAMDAFKSNPNNFDIVIVDHNMPVLTGLQLAREMIKIRPNIPIILLTGFKNKHLSDRAKASGIKTVIIKPIDIQELSGAIRKVLS